MRLHPAWDRSVLEARSRSLASVVALALLSVLLLLAIAYDPQRADTVPPNNTKLRMAHTVLRNGRGVEVTILHVGATIQKLLVPDKHGKVVDVVLGFDNVQAYEVRCCQLPCVV